jgi:hypothetical protein
MNMLATRLAPANANCKRKISSANRIMMYGIEMWPSNADNHWLSNMNEARVAATQSALDPALIKTAASMGISRLVRKVDEFQTRKFEKIRLLMSWQEVPISEVTQEIQSRIVNVGSAFDLSEEQISRAVALGLARYIDDGGSPEFAIQLADLMGIVEENRFFLRLAAEPYDAGDSIVNDFAQHGFPALP